MTTTAAARNPTHYSGDLRRDLMVAALQAVAESGPAQLSLRDLSRRLGVSHAAPKNHFRDKRALLTALATEAHERLAQCLAQEIGETGGATRGGGDAMNRFMRGGRAYLRFARENPASFAVMWREDLQDREDAGLLEATARTLGPLVELASDVTALTLTDQDPLQVALLAWSTVHGLADLSASGALDDLPGSLDPAARDEQLLELMETLFTRAGAGREIRPRNVPA